MSGEENRSLIIITFFGTYRNISTSFSPLYT